MSSLNEIYDSDLKYALDISKAEQLSLNNIKYPIPSKYKIQIKMMNCIYDSNDFYEKVRCETVKFNKWLFTSINKMIDKKLNNSSSKNSQDLIDIFRISKWTFDINSIESKLKLPNKDNKEDIFKCDRFRDLLIQYCKYNNISCELYVVLRDPIYESIKFFDLMLTYIRPYHLIKLIYSFYE